MGRKSCYCAFFLSLLLAVAGQMFSQSRTVEITGTVSDAQNKAAAGAVVEVTNEATGVKISTVTNDAGIFRVQNLTSGSYRVEVSISGFRKMVQTGFLLETGQIGRLDVVLQVGEVNQSVEVTAASPLLQT